MLSTRHPLRVPVRPRAGLHGRPRPRPLLRPSSRGAGARARPAHVTRRPGVCELFLLEAPGEGVSLEILLFGKPGQHCHTAFSRSLAKCRRPIGSFALPGPRGMQASQQDEESRAVICSALM